MNAVQRLGADTAAALYAAQRLATLSGVLYELVANSVAANATGLRVRIDLTGWTIECADNGDGFHKESIGFGGTPGLIPYVTEVGKSTARGESLACLAHLGILQITTHIRGTDQSYSITQRGTTVLHAGLATRRSGSVVTVYGLYGSLPVRRKAAVGTHAATRRLRMRLRDTMCGLALANPHVSMALEFGFTFSAKRSDLETRAKDVYGIAFQDPFIASQKIPVAFPRPCTAVVEVIISQTLVPAVQQHVSVNGIPLPRTTDVASAYADFAARQYMTLDDACDLYVRISNVISTHLRSAAMSRRRPARWRHLHPAFVIRVTLVPAQDAGTRSLSNGIISAVNCALMNFPRPLPRRARSVEPPETDTENNSRCSSAPPGGAVDAPISSVTAPVDPVILPSLENAQVVAQVDRKYILCRVRDGAETSLFCMDQHAVDERVRFESTVAAYVTACVSAAAGDAGARPVCSVALDDPFLVPNAHIFGVQNHQATLAFWGFGFSRDEVAVTHVPPMLRAYDGNAMNTMLDAFCAWLNQHARETHEWLSTAVRGDASSSTVLLAALRHLPPRFVDAICTSACRNAIRE